MAGPEVPRAFFSYVRRVDDHDGGRLSRLRERLQGEIRVQTGLRIEIFQDIRELHWGDRWQERLLEAAAGALFLIPVVTPGYFLSESCRKEYEAFRTLATARGIRGVILPIYYVETPKSEAPTGSARLPTRREIVVDAGGAGQFCTISDAVKAAAADDILLVRPATYKESVIIEKSLTVIGDGPREQIVVETGTGNTFRLKAPFGRLVNLTIRRSESTIEDFAVWILGGRFEVEGCDISSASLTCIGVSGDADPTLRRNRFLRTRHAAILVYEQGRATIESNDIAESGTTGVAIQGAAATIRGNRMQKGRGTSRPSASPTSSAPGTSRRDRACANARTLIGCDRRAVG